MFDKLMNWMRSNTYEISCFIWISILVLLGIHVLTNTIDPLIAGAVLLILDNLKNFIL